MGDPRTGRQEPRRGSSARTDATSPVDPDGRSGLERRTLLSGALAATVGATGVPSLTKPSGAGQADPENTLRVTKEGAADGQVEFTVTVSGEIEPTDDFEDEGSDSIDGNTATGLVGPESGTDTVRYSGEITDFSLDGPALVYRNGERVGPGDLPGWGEVLPNALVVTKEGAADGRAEFEATVSGDLEPGDDFESEGRDSIDGNTATGVVGPEGGTDSIRYSGVVTDFSLDGPAVVSRNGETVEPAELGSDDRLVRVTPVAEDVTVAPDADLLFEVTAREFSGDSLTAEWFVDGERAVGPDRPALNDEYRTRGETFDLERFEEPGAHDVRVTAYVEDTDEELGTVAWSVTVAEDAGTPPSTRRISPSTEEVSVAPDETVDFTLGVSDPDGDLHRAIWWIGMCDDRLGTTDVDGSADETTVSHGGGEECPIFAWVVDERGHRTMSESWTIVDEPTDGDGALPNTLEVTKAGAEDGQVAFAVAVSGDIEPTENFEDEGSDSVGANTATGLVGPESGTDTVRYSGGITDFSLSGPALVYRNDESVDPDELGG